MTTFDVFLSHNSTDKPIIREIGKGLQRRGLNVWLDEWELAPGTQWQAHLEEAIENTRSAAIFVGADGFGPWEQTESRACVSQFVSRGLPVIPVKLPGFPAAKELPLFLFQFTMVDLSEGVTEESLDRLVWGITGKRPEPRDPAKRDDRQKTLLGDMKYYVYISRTKLEMLSAQLGYADDSSGSEISAMVAQIEAVMDALSRSGQLGNAETLSAPFIEATLTVKASYYGMRDEQLVMWISNSMHGTTQRRICLGGSAHHIIGNSQVSGHAYSASATETIEHVLRKELNLERDEYEHFYARDPELLDELEDSHQPFPRPCTHRENDFTRGLALASRMMDEEGRPAQNITTVFRVLGRWQADRVKECKPGHGFPEHVWFELEPEAESMDLILGTPLYIALS